MRHNSMNKQKQTIIIIGGSSGMGLATAKLALTQNYRVIIASRNEEKLKKALLNLNHPDAVMHPVDTTDEESIKQLFLSFPNFDHLVIPGSEVSFENIRNATVATAKKSFDSKFFGPFRVIQAALDKINPTGSITLFSGTSGQKPEAGSELLSAMNAAVESFAKGLAISLAPLRFNTIAPGIINTPVFDNIDDQTKVLFKQFTDKLLIKRMGTAEEAAQGVMFLVNNNYVTGMTLSIDGGHVIS